jgi:hypothetical protein
VYQEKENLFKDFSRGTSEVRDLLEKEKEDIRFEVLCRSTTLVKGRRIWIKGTVQW